MFMFTLLPSHPHTISIFFSISSSIWVSKETTQQQLMANDVVLRTCLVCLGALILLIGLYTNSFKKMFATYVFGILAISGILLPDWDFFDRDFSQWVYPMSADNDSAQTHRSKRFRFYPVRVVLYTMIYSFGLYKWWMYVFNT